MRNGTDEGIIFHEWVERDVYMARSIPLDVSLTCRDYC
jgi:hypothetical protein